jgi:hypothetical protein
VIVISGALVLVSLVLLVLGVTQSDINLVYGCIVVSLVSLVFLVLGIVQRRGEVLPGTAGSTPDPHGATVGQAPAAQPGNSPERSVPLDDVPAQSGPSGDDADDTATSLPPAEEPVAGGEAPVEGTVLVVANRPRYHVGGCRYLAGKQAQEVDLVDAREAGFTPCGVCKPDAQLAGADRTVSAGAGELPAAAPAAAPVASSTGRSGSRPVGSDPATPESGAAVAAVRVPSSVASTPPAPASHVVVVPDRNRYHRADCRHVRDAAGTEQLTPAQAGQQGYSACGVCKP